MATKSRTAADRQRAAQIRDWAAAEGLTVARQGRLPRSVEAAYDAATAAGDGDGGPGPDWGAAGAADPLDLDAPDEDFPGGVPPGEDAAAEPPSPGPAPAPGPAPPPPASLDDARERLAGRAPRVPPWAGSRGGGGAQRPAAAPVKITPALARDIEGKLALLVAVPAAVWETADPVCGGAFAANLDNAVRKAVPLICQSPAAVRMFTTGGQWLLWLDLIMALSGTGQAIYAHHVAHTVTVVDGRPVPARRLPDGRVVPADAAGPPPERDWSQYTTDIPGHVPPVHPAAAG
jgi:Lsr2